MVITIHFSGRKQNSLGVFEVHTLNVDIEEHVREACQAAGYEHIHLINAEVIKTCPRCGTVNCASIHV